MNLPTILGECTISIVGQFMHSPKFIQYEIVHLILWSLKYNTRKEILLKKNE